MKSIVLVLSAVATLASARAFAAETVPHFYPAVNPYGDSVTGVVQVEQPMCMVAPCPAIVSIKSGDSVTKIAWNSKMGDDLAAFKGKTVTVNGAISKGAMNPAAFMPGTSKDFVTGKISTRCMNGASTCKAFITVDGKQYPIHGDFKNYAGLDGVTVTVPGSIHGNCPIGAMCIVNFVEFYPSSNDVMLKGNLGILYTAANPTRPIVPQAGNYLMTFEDGKTLVVDSKKNLMDRNGSDVWMLGHMNAGGGDLAPYFSATKVSAAVSDNHSPLTVAADAGNNAGRDANTTPTASSQPAGHSSQGAGVAH